MRVAYLVLAHGDPRMLALLIEALRPEATERDVFLHIDAKSPLTQFSHDIRARTHLVEPRIPVFWGHSSVTAASVELLKAACRMADYDYYHLISGADFLLQPVEKFEKYLDQMNPYSFLPCRSVHGNWEARKRFRGYYVLRERTSLGIVMQKLLFALCLLSPFGRNGLPGIRFELGSQWFTIHKTAVSCFIEFWEREDVQRFFRWTYCSDEMFFATALVNGPQRDLHKRTSLRFMKWTGAPSPKVLDRADLGELQESEFFFARKFDSLRSAEALRWLAAERHGIDAMTVGI